MKPVVSSLLFIRHAQTALAGTFCGRTDPRLDATGLAQLPSLLERVRAQPSGGALDAIYTSDLQRAQETAGFLASPANMTVISRPALREIDFGDWEALTWNEIEERDRTYANRWITEFPDLPAPNGETISHFKHRVLTEIAFLRIAANGRHIAVVTHAGVLRVLLEELGHFSPHHAWERTRDYTGTIRCTQQTSAGALELHP